MDAVETLITGLTTTGTDVTRERTFAFADGVTDGLSLFMIDDSPIQVYSQDKIDSELQFQIVGHTKNANVEQQLNLIKSEVTVALKTDYTLGLNFVHFIKELGWDQPELDGEYETPAGKCTGNFLVLYRRDYTDPDT